MKRLLFILLFLLCFTGFSQNDCVEAIVVCGSNDYVDLNATGVGVQELSGSNTCSSQENNSIWLKIRINAGGTLGFTITPTNANGSTNNDINVDFDFFIFGPNASCNNIGQAIRCSTTNPQAANQGNNLTGLRTSDSDTSEGPGSNGNSFVKWLTVSAGDSYFLVIDRPIGSSNFKIDWTGTATFNTPPVATPPVVGNTYNIDECDNDGVLDNVTIFDLTINTPSLIDSQTDVEVSYFVNNTDAQTGSNAIVDPTKFKNTSDPQIIFARITNKTTNCFSAADFSVNVTDGLVFTTQDILVCDDNNDDTWSFNFTLYDEPIINGVSDVFVSYFLNENDAKNSMNKIIGNYQNISNPQTIWARLESSVGGCFGVRPFEVEVFDTPIVTTPPTIILCDDDNNGTMPFDLLSQNALINTDAGMSITYHITQADADGNINVLVSPFESGTVTVFARVENVANTLCYDVIDFDLIVYNSPFPLESYNITNLSFCDNTTFGTDTDGLIIFDLTTRETEILNGQSPTDFTLTYFTNNSYSSASQILNPTSFQNNSVTQTIYVRMTNNDSNGTCFKDTSFNIDVFKLPVLLPSPFLLEQCDDDFDGYNAFNLTEIEAEIIPTANITTEIFIYYTTQAASLAGVPGTEITNKTTYTNKNPNTDMVWVRIENENSCFRTTQVNLKVKPSAIPTNILYPFYSCDDGTDTTDGIASFDFSSVTQLIKNIFPVDVDVYYYKNEADATAEIDEIDDPSDYRNEGYPNYQEIWVRAESILGNDCLGNGHHITLIVDSLPQFELDKNDVICAGSNIILETFNPAENNYIYEWTYNGTDILSSITSQITISKPGTYSVIASQIASSGDVCFSEPREIIVIESDIAIITLDDVVIVDDSDNNTVTINNDTNNLGIGDYEFSLNDEFGVYQDEPFFEHVLSGIHIVYVRDKNSCGVASLEISVIGFPKFFTPNNDGYNDNWQVLGLSSNFYASSLIYIYDRFGKTLAKVDPTSNGWNGFYKGEMLPSDDYWFSVQLTDINGNIRSRKGHFSMIRR